MATLNQPFLVQQQPYPTLQQPQTMRPAPTPAAPYVGDAERKELERCQEIIARLLNFRRPYDVRRGEMHRHLVGKPVERTYPDGRTKRHSVFMPYPHANVKKVRAAIDQGIFAFNPPFEVLPGGVRDEDAAYKMQRVLEKKVLREGRLRSVVYDFLGGLAAYGTYGLYVGWDWDYDLKTSLEVVPQLDPGGLPVINPVTQQPSLVRQWIRHKIPRSRPKFAPVDVYDLLIDPDGAYVARLFDKTLPQLLREQEVSVELVSKGACQKPLYEDAALARLIAYISAAFGTGSKDGAAALIHMAELWDVVNSTCTLLVIPEDQTSLALKDQRYAARASTYSTFRRVTSDAPAMLLAPTYENPYAHNRVPLLYTFFDKLPGDSVGMGLIEPTYLLNENLNAFLGALADNWDLGINKRVVVDETRVYDTKALQENNVPGGVIGVDGDPNSLLRVLEAYTPAAGDYNIIPLYKNMIEVDAGISEFYGHGVGSPTGNRTATGIGAVIGESNRLLSPVMMLLTEDILQPALEMSAANCQQFLTDGVEVRITDEVPSIPKVQSDYLTVSHADLQGAFDFRIVGAAYMDNPVVTQRNFLALLNLLMADPYTKHPAAERELLRVFRVPFPNRLLRTDEEVAQMMAQAAAQQAAAPPPSGGRRMMDRRPAQLEGNIPGASVTGVTRSLAQQNGANALGLGGLSGETTGLGG